MAHALKLITLQPVPATEPLCALHPTENWQPFSQCMNQEQYSQVLNSHKGWSLMCFLGGRIILIKWVRCKNSFFIVETSWHSSRPPDLKNFTDVKKMLVPTSGYFLSLGLQYATYISGPSSNDVTNVIVTFCGRFRWSRSLQTTSWQRVGGYCALSWMNTVASDPTSSGPVPDSWLLLVHVG